MNAHTQGVRDDVAEAVARGAHDVERYATATKSHRVTGATMHAAAAATTEPTI